jgi:hypothetical protein
MSADDIRAVENPISALFDLAEDVNSEAPRIRKLVRYASVFIYIWLIIDFLLILATIGGSLLIGGLLIAIFVLGVITLGLLSRLNDFFRYYVMRHRAIISVRNDEPVVMVPLGPTPSARLLRHMANRNPELNYLYPPDFVPQPAPVRGRSGAFYPMDVHLIRYPGLLFRLFGRGYPGYQLIVRRFDRAPSPADILWMKNAAEDIAAGSQVPASRVILLWTRNKDEDLSEESYNVLMSQIVRFVRRGNSFACSIELIIENEDGTYEFIPYIADQIRI